jgi:thiol-disulfide isomerase/thioredoxin
MRTFASLGIALALSLSAAAGAQAPATASPTRIQGEVDPSTGAPSLMPKGASTPSKGWSDAEKSDAAVQRANTVLTAVQRAYQSAKQLSDRARITIAMPAGVQEEVVDLTFGAGNDVSIRAGSVQMLAVGDTAYFVPNEPADKFMSRKMEGNASSTFAAMIPGMYVPTPHLALRQPLPGAKTVDAFSVGVMKGAAVKGFRESPGIQEVLLAGDGSEAVVTIDAATEFVRSMSILFTPEGLPDGVKIGFDIRMTPSDAPLEKPVAFDAGKRTAVSKVEDLFAPPPDDEVPGMTVKEGQPAPLATLTTMDGKSFDLASLAGKVVVIDFWATWCGPCRKGLPLLQKFADESKSNDKVAVIAVNVWEKEKGDELTKKVMEFWSKQGFKMQVMLDPDAALIGKYGFQGIPACIVIGPDGKLLTTHIGYDEDMPAKLRADVAKALGTGK